MITDKEILSSILGVQNQVDKLTAELEQSPQVYLNDARKAKEEAKADDINEP